MPFVNFVLVALTILVLLAVPVAVIIIRRMGRVVATDTLVFNEDPKLANGSVVGRLIEKTTGKNGRLHIKMIPFDSFDKKPIEIIKEPNKIISYPKGTFSKNMSLLRIIPDDSLTYYSNMLSRIENEAAAMNIIKAQQEGLNRQAMHLEQIGMGELSAAHIGQLSRSNEEILRSKVKEADRRPTTNWREPVV